MISLPTISGRWADSAACRGRDPELFHPKIGRRDIFDAPKAICRSCPVEDECLAFALTTEKAGLENGVWGGMSPRERQELRRVLEQADVA